MSVFGYCRTATTRQASGDPSLQVQRGKISHYATTKGWAVAEFFLEIGISGSIPLAERPEGKRLWAVLQPGDVIVTAKLDHVFRAAVDTLDLLERLERKKVSLHVVDLGGEITGDAIQKLNLTLRAEREYIPEQPPGQVISLEDRKPKRDQ
jgi:putative DNA-invertase from lambdoid prophage Rac